MVGTGKGFERTAVVSWQGDLRGGNGSVSTESQVLSAIPVTWAARIEEHGMGRTSPEELLAAAHATCYAMSLASTLSKNEVKPSMLEVRAICSLAVDGGGLRINRMKLIATVYGTAGEESRVTELARRAESACPVSSVLRSGLEIELEVHTREEVEPRETATHVV